MKILIVCDQGNNRSVVLAHHLKYWGHDCIPVGLSTNGIDTLAMLMDWADRIIVVDESIDKAILQTTGGNWEDKMQLWNIGPDHYPRPFNPELQAVVRRLMDEHRAEYKK